MIFSATTKKTVDIIVPLAAASLTGWYMIRRDKDKLQNSLIVSAIVFAVAYIAVSQITKAIHTAAVDSGVSNTQKEKIQKDSNVTSQQYSEAESIAKNVYIAYFGEDGNAWFEDEEAAISALQKIDSIEMVKAVCNIYYVKYGKSLKANTIKYVQIADGFNLIPLIVRNNWF